MITNIDTSLYFKIYKNPTKMSQPSHSNKDIVYYL